jgi:prepilin-type processing-associated H-X9-DG protein
LLFPDCAQAKAAAKKAVCLSNVRQIVLASVMYSDDNDDVGPCAVVGLHGAGLNGGWIFYTRFPADDDKLPGSYQPQNGTLFPYVKNRTIFACPTDVHAQISGNSYAINSCVLINESPYDLGMNLTSFQDPSSLAWYIEEYEGEDPVGGSSDDGFYLYPINFVSGRHSGLSNLGFLDGHVKSLSPSMVLGKGYVFKDPENQFCR